MKKRVKAIVRVVMDVEDCSVWNDDTTFAQIAKQAEDGVRGLLTGGNELLSMKVLQRRIKSLVMQEVRIFPEEVTDGPK